MRYLKCFLVLIAVVYIGGCGKGMGQVPVAGKVTYEDGTPLAGVIVIFSDDAKGISANAATKDDGTFELGTEKPGDGAPVGPYKVTVLPGTDPNTGGANANIDPKFQTVKNTPLSFQVQDDDNNFEIKVSKATKIAEH